LGLHQDADRSVEIMIRVDGSGGLGRGGVH
jgi:hypothetical protein